MLIAPLKIRDLLLLKMERVVDSRGYFVETYSKRTLEGVGIGADFVQDNEAFSADAGTLRGLHFQVAPASQAKLVRVVAGAIFDVAVDIRKASPSYGKWCATILRSERAEMLHIPTGFAHGYLTLMPDTLVAYKVDRFYDRRAEAGIYWNDPDIGIDWPKDNLKIKVSDRDKALPLLRDVDTTFQF